MTRPRRWTPDLRYSDWHRTLHPCLKAMDVDLVEYCGDCGEPLALFELAAAGQAAKDDTRPLRQLADRSGVSLYVARTDFPAGAPVERPAVPLLAPETLKVKRWDGIEWRFLGAFEPHVWEDYLLSLHERHVCRGRP